MMENGQSGVRVELGKLEKTLGRTLREIGLRREAVFVRLVTDAEMKRLNAEFRGKRKTTDVLSFPMEERNWPENLARSARKTRGKFLGDIAIAPGVARRNAKRFGRTTTEEICALMLHGVLHLLGYDHETDRGEMDEVEARLRRRLGLAE